MKQQNASYENKFQFHKGTIRTGCRGCYFNRLRYFNSIKVRLERELASGVRARIEFQFHKGTIRTEEPQMPDGRQTFQFHKGTIRTEEIDNLVQKYTAFQFHKGTIRTHIRQILFGGLSISIP